MNLSFFISTTSNQKLPTTEEQHFTYRSAKYARGTTHALFSTQFSTLLTYPPRNYGYCNLYNLKLKFVHYPNSAYDQFQGNE